MRIAKLSADIAKGVLRDRAMRRRTMSGLVLAASAMLMAGVTLLAQWLVERPFLFMLFWLLCGWLTVCALLMAVFDILVIRRQARESRKRLRKEVFGEDREQKDDDGGEGR